MKCPKCGYLGFETSDRCRNCGYDFSLTGLMSSAGPAGENELMIKMESEASGPPMDLALGPESAARPESRMTHGTDQVFDLDRMSAMPAPPRRGTTTPEEFLLFPSEAADPDAPFARSRAAPRPPLAVRRTTPRGGAVDSAPRQVRSALSPSKGASDALGGGRDPAWRERPPQTPRPARPGRFESPPLAGLGLPAVAGDRVDMSAEAPPVRRLAGALVDLVLLGAIDAAVVYFTLRLSGLEFGDMTLLPRAPLAGFFLLLNGGYFVTFAAIGGQTIGQMAFGLKVVGDDGMPLTFGKALVRTLAWVVSTLPLGLGLWFAMRGGRRTLHDRLTATRVVLS